MGIGKQSKTLNKNQIEMVRTFLRSKRNGLRNETIFLLSVKGGLRSKEISLLSWKMVLKSDGTFALSVPKFFPEWICWKLSKDYQNEPGGHVRIFKYKELKNSVKSLGFVFKFLLHHASQSLLVESPKLRANSLAFPKSLNLRVYLIFSFEFIVIN